MKRRVPMKTGDEYDLLTPWKKWEIYRAGDRKKVKKLFNRRERRFLNNPENHG